MGVEAMQESRHILADHGGEGAEGAIGISC